MVSLKKKKNSLKCSKSEMQKLGYTSEKLLFPVDLISNKLEGRPSQGHDANL